MSSNDDWEFTPEELAELREWFAETKKTIDAAMDQAVLEARKLKDIEDAKTGKAE
jgi:hypothetical protein